MTLLDASTDNTPVIGDGEFFAPAPHGMIDGLLGQYRELRARIEQVTELVESKAGGALHYFLQGNGERRNRYEVTVAELFKREGAIAALNAEFWQRTLALTDVYDCMPEARRREWSEQITNMTTPDYTEDSVGPTIESLLLAREQFFAERVDGIFRALSGDHVTNSPNAFGQRMILAYVFNSYDTVEHSRAGVINDLRAVIARFMGRDEPKWNASPDMLRRCRRRPGEWHPIDGGTLRVRVYKKGTAHLEVHPEIAYRLNNVLAFLYPHAIAASQRVKPAKPSKEFRPMKRPLPFEVIDVIADARVDSGGRSIRLAYSSFREKNAEAEARRVLEAVGGVGDKHGMNFAFDYDARQVIDEIVTSGCVPDARSHQFYPTPDSIAAEVIELANIEETSRCLEPSAGHGSLASRLPADRTVCVEISELHCQILRAKGLQAECADFLTWAVSAAPVDRICMNPPFSEGRALLHLQAASRLLAPGGRLVAVLPASLRGKELLPGFAGSWSRVYANEFAGTSVSVSIYTAVRPS